MSNVIDATERFTARREKETETLRALRAVKRVREIIGDRT